MKHLLEWTLEQIRREDACFSWMEEYRFDWVPPVSNFLGALLEGKSVLIASDEEHRWFVNYILSDINRFSKKRPLLPFYSLEGCFEHLDTVQESKRIEALEDLLSLTFGNGYIFWFIGSTHTQSAKIIQRNEESLLWVSEQGVRNAFVLPGQSSDSDIRLLQLYKLLDKTITAAVLGELDIVL